MKSPDKLILQREDPERRRINGELSLPRLAWLELARLKIDLMSVCEFKLRKEPLSNDKGQLNMRASIELIHLNIT